MADFLTTISSAKDWPESWKDLQVFLLQSMLLIAASGNILQ
jgi:hypothetical protein